MQTSLDRLSTDQRRYIHQQLRANQQRVSAYEKAVSQPRNLITNDEASLLVLLHQALSEAFQGWFGDGVVTQHLGQR